MLSASRVSTTHSAANPTASRISLRYFQTRTADRRHSIIRLLPTRTPRPVSVRGHQLLATRSLNTRLSPFPMLASAWAKIHELHDGRCAKHDHQDRQREQGHRDDHPRGGFPASLHNTRSF